MERDRGPGRRQCGDRNRQRPEPDVAQRVGAGGVLVGPNDRNRAVARRGRRRRSVSGSVRPRPSISIPAASGLTRKSATTIEPITTTSTTAMIRHAVRNPSMSISARNSAGDAANEKLTNALDKAVTKPRRRSNHWAIIVRDANVSSPWPLKRRQPNPTDITAMPTACSSRRSRSARAGSPPSRTLRRVRRRAIRSGRSLGRLHRGAGRSSRYRSGRRSRAEAGETGRRDQVVGEDADAGGLARNRCDRADRAGDHDAPSRSRRAAASDRMAASPDGCVSTWQPLGPESTTAADRRFGTMPWRLRLRPWRASSVTRCTRGVGARTPPRGGRDHGRRPLRRWTRRDG